MHGTYQPLLVILSIVVAILASYTVLELADHCSTAADVRWRTRWLAGGALVLGAGIWAMDGSERSAERARAARMETSVDANGVEG